MQLKNKLRYFATLGAKDDMSEVGYVVYYVLSSCSSEDATHFSRDILEPYSDIDFDTLYGKDSHQHKSQPRDPNLVGSGIVKYRDGLITKQVHEDLASGKCKYLILDYSLEGYHNIDWDYVSTITGVEKSKLVWITSIWNPEFMNRQSEVTVCFTNFWERFLSKITKIDYSALERNMSTSPWSLGFDQQMKDINERKVRKYFAFSYNRQPRWHRAVLLTRLKLQGLLDNTSYSWGNWNNMLTGFVDSKFETAKEHGFLNEWTRKTWTEIASSDEVLISDDEDLNINKAFDINFNHVKDCYFQIVTETWVENSLENDATPFLSEKSYKPFMCAMPFVVWGQKGTIEALRQQGYNMFDEWIDHSYDNIIDDGERLSALMDEIKRLYSIPDWPGLIFYMRHALLGNYNNMYLRTRITNGRNHAQYHSFDSVVEGANDVDWSKEAFFPSRSKKD